ncbi:MAG: SDR family oxidoreductase [Candidatus Dormibacteraeota bacterium]|uniref:SDR family oxidoreductase n=1 Tax=Candidatus Amunia macphersoniae TaxID=3127014 RepID=A0A934NG17_9BACT|nr:SDR family oxidoreductase [Candidatus Dormibacteraeota bacterium]
MSRPIPPSVAALVTGASSGIGAEFARQLAARGHDLTLVARRVDRLQTLAKTLRRDHAITVSVHPADLETAEGRAPVVALLRTAGPWLLINNAGFGSRGRFVDLDPDREVAEVELNVVALHELTTAVLAANVALGQGGVVNVASTAAYQAIPYMATYAATKAFVLTFTEAIAHELHGSGVRAMALCPGPTRTEFVSVAGVESLFDKSMPMTSAAVVRSALRTLDRGHAICVPGAHNLLLAQGPRLVPRSALRRVIGTIFAPG